MSKLTLKFMEMCYQSCCFGHAEPTHVIMSVARREELRGLIISACKIRVPSPWTYANGPLGFNGADILGLPDFPEGYIWMANIMRPDKEGLNQRFLVEE